MTALPPIDQPKRTSLSFGLSAATRAAQSATSCFSLCPMVK